jgi:type IV fimbrial biogenesis protein FimT
MSRQYIRGFTLVELMVTISIVAVMATIAIPSFQEFIRQTRVTTQTNDFITVLNYARSEAIKQGRSVIVCKSTNSVACVAGGNWGQGWLAYIDANGNDAKDAGETVIRVHSAFTGNSTLVGGATLTNWIKYLPTGLAVGNGGATANGVAASQLTLCPQAPANGVGRTIEIGFTGRIKSTSNAGCP